MAQDILYNLMIFLFTEEEYLEFMVEYISLLNPALILNALLETPPRLLPSLGPRYDQIG
jgi:hypothetical protein